MAYRTGQVIELHTPAAPYYDQQTGFTDHDHMIPAKTERMQITRVSTRKDGHTLLTLRNPFDRTGFSVDVEKWTAWRGLGRTLRVVS